MANEQPGKGKGGRSGGEERLEMRPKRIYRTLNSERDRAGTLLPGNSTILLERRVRTKKCGFNVFGKIVD